MTGPATETTATGTGAAEDSRPAAVAPETRLAVSFVFALAVAFVRGLPAAGAALAAGVVLTVAVTFTAGAAPPVRALLRRLAGVNVFLALVWVTLPLTLPWPEAAGRAFLLTVKCNAVFLVFQALAGGLTAAAAGRALAGLGLPDKLVFLVFFTGRHIHAVRDEWSRLRTAAALRSFAAGTNLHTYRTIGNMLGLTVVRAAERGQRVYEAMLLRGFDGRFRTITEARPGRADALFAAVFFLALGGILLFDMTGGQA